MCANRNLFMPISPPVMIDTGLTTIMLAAIATVAMATVTPTVLATEIISSIESKTYKGGHSGHRKPTKSLKIKKYADNGSTEGSSHCIKKNKVGNYCDRYDHTTETLTGIGFSAFGIYGHYRVHCDQPCLLSTLNNTALRTSALQIPSTVRLEHSRLGPRMGPCRPRSEGLLRVLKRQSDISYCPNPRRQPSLEKRGSRSRRREAPRLSPNR